MVPSTLSAAPEAPLPELLLESLRRMAAAGHTPVQYVVLRLTDGRLRAHALLDEHASPFELIGQIRNESGPLGSAFLVGSKVSGGAVELFVEDLLDGRRLEQCAGGIPGRDRWEAVTNRALAPRSDSPNTLRLAPPVCSRPFTTIAAG